MGCHVGTKLTPKFVTRCTAMIEDETAAAILHVQGEILNLAVAVTSGSGVLLEIHSSNINIHYLKDDQERLSARKGQRN